MPCPARTVGPSGPSSLEKGGDGKDEPGFHVGIAGWAEDPAGSAKGSAAGAESLAGRAAAHGALCSPGSWPRRLQTPQISPCKATTLRRRLSHLREPAEVGRVGKPWLLEG